jgi:putative NADH-flavin reductase
MPRVVHRKLEVEDRVPDYAAAIADAVEGSSFVGTRFTAAY